MIGFDIRRLVYYLTPPFMRRSDDNEVTTHVTWIQYLMTPLNYVYSLFDAHRSATLSHVRLYGIRSLEWLLQRDVDNAITIDTVTGDSLTIYSLADEEEGSVIYSLADEEDGTVAVSIDDITYIGDVVIVPDSDDNDKVVAIIEKYRILGTKYKIENT